MKQFISFTTAVLFSIFLFFIMHLLINTEVKARPKQSLQTIDIYMAIKEPKLNHKIRRKPPKLEEIQKKPNQPKTLAKKPIKVPITVAKVAGSITGFNQSFTPKLSGELGIVGADKNGDSVLTPRVRVQPMYPQTAAREGKEGFVTLSFDINDKGDPVNINIIEAKPRGYFEKSARRSLAKWKYQPKRVNGEPVAVLNQSITLAFKLDAS